MAVCLASFILCLYFNLISGYTLLGNDDNEIVWPTEYHMKGEKINFMTTLKQPFEIWYSAELNRSHVDYYDGVNQKFYCGDTGTVYTYFPTINEESENEFVCLKKSSDDALVDFMPFVDSLTFTGETTYLFDKVVDVWSNKDLKDNMGDMTMEETLYIYKTDGGVDIPVQHIIKIFNPTLGELEKHYVINYYNFNDTVTEEDLTPREDLCLNKGQLGEDFESDILMLHPDIPGELDLAFETYANRHSKQYHETEMQRRKIIFEQNWRMVQEHNHKNLGFKLKVNEFSDRTNEELKYLTGTYVSETPAPEIQSFPYTQVEVDEIVKELPENFDLRMEGSVTSVKHQGSCGSCWAFSTTAAVEGAVARATGDRLLDLSEQSLVDCAWNYGNFGCNGGTLDGALKYVLANGIPTERSYGVYIEHDGICKIHNMTSSFTIQGFSMVTPRNPDALKVALYKYGPVTVAIHATRTMMNYANGIFYDLKCEDNPPNHGVTVVGYGVRDGEDYWIVKNSWGENWGEDGYILMSARNDNCFLLDTPYYPIV